MRRADKRNKEELCLEDDKRVPLIDHWREQRVECPCGQLLNLYHVHCNVSWDRKRGVELLRCLYNESLSYKVKPSCRSGMETIYHETGHRLTKDFKCLLCDQQRTREDKNIDCPCFCSQCKLGDYRCKCCKVCRKYIVHCLMFNRCHTLKEVQESM